MQHSPVTKV